MRIDAGLTEQAGEQGHKDEADQGDTAASHELLHTLALGSGIVIAISFQEVDRAPNGETCAQGNHEGLENIDGRVKEIHKKVAGINLKIVK